MKGSRWFAVALVWCVAVPGVAWGGRVPGARPQSVRIVDQSQTVDINRINMIVTNVGSFAYDISGNHPGLEFPSGTGRSAIYAAGIWLGGKVGNNIRLSIMDYTSEWGPGPIISPGVPADPAAAEHKVYKLNRVYTDPAVRDAALLDYNAGALPDGADTVLVLPDGTLGLRPVGHTFATIDSIGPFLGDQMLWGVYNDANASNHINQAGSTAPLGVEVQQTTFAFDRLGALGQTVFVRYRLINKSGATIDSMYVSQWSDPDLGDAFDDIVGCDQGLSVGFCYNATKRDNVYGDSPPCPGFDFFKGPTGYAGTELGQTSFNKYINGTDPDNANKTYNYMKGLNPDGSVVINPVTNQPTTFVVDGDPVGRTGWLDTNPADRRMMLSSGPFEMTAGGTQEVVVGLVIGDASNNLSSVALMKFYDATAQSAFDQNFDLAPPPDSPVVSATALSDGVYLNWDSSSEQYNEPPYQWEGYVVYQGESVAGPWTRVATFDLANGILTVLDPDFDEESGLALPQVKALGNDGGLRYQILLTDLITGGPLRPGTTYFYSVNAYAVGIGSVPQVLESSFNPIAVTPQAPAADVDLGAATATTPVYGQTAPGVATSDSVRVTVVNPDSVKTATYRVGYKPDAVGNLVWYLVRTMGTQVDTVLNNQTNFSGDNAYTIIDGLLVQVVGAPVGTQTGALTLVSYINAGPNPPSYVGFHNALAFFDGSADYVFVMQTILAGLSSKFDPATDIAEFSNVELRFGTTQKAYQYVQSAAAPRTYPYRNYLDVPFTAWDVDAEPDRQLNIGLFEWAAGDSNGIFQPDTLPDPFAFREWIYVLQSSYSGDATPDPFYTTTFPNARTYADTLDFMYVLWPAQALDANHNPIPADPGDKISFILFSRTTNDFFTFSTTAPNRSNTSLAQGEMARVKAVPNPYFARSRYETFQDRRVVKFTHLPARCTVRLFNLAGDQVRTLEKDDGSTSLLSWDLETDSGLPVGSGVYIFHVDAPGIGSTTGKLVIFLERERLNTF